jgi:hypothetical protein
MGVGGGGRMDEERERERELRVCFLSLEMMIGRGVFLTVLQSRNSYYMLKIPAFCDNVLVRPFTEMS